MRRAFGILFISSLFFVACLWTKRIPAGNAA